jgi:hypothetical protein
VRKADDGLSSDILFSSTVGGCHATGCAVLELVRLAGATQIHRLKRKGQLGHVEYWNAGCGESRMSGVDGGKERKLLPIRTISRVWLSLSLSWHGQLVELETTDDGIEQQ